ncbi:hypothetical protein TGAM01_v200779 [Trichoderma gamsii]|uniref:Uncharacterized protein n=1 Tax=Trichoderma gamsii TaxID=398673 RepID=A0A2P5A1B4_9HYPO|nr:hypothetical protein TGAM01_v200779 [Trichoderma gamsii]PON30339.1 hypothetical protein TGAM01_v200779 [Trichoderma gamsii]
MPRRQYLLFTTGDRQLTSGPPLAGNELAETGMARRHKGRLGMPALGASVVSISTLILDLWWPARGRLLTACKRRLKV